MPNKHFITETRNVLAALLRARFKKKNNLKMVEQPLWLEQIRVDNPSNKIAVLGLKLKTRYALFGVSCFKFFYSFSISLRL